MKTMTEVFDQSEFEVRCEWGLPGVVRLAPISDVIIIVDVLSFSTAVEIATSRGAVVFPYRWRDASAQTYAESVDAVLAQPKRSHGYTLSPSSLLDIPAGYRLVLPSPNGSTLSLSTGQTVTLAGCLRNCAAIAHDAQQQGQRIAVIPAGEHWSDGSLRPALEDWLGAGAILSEMKGRRSPEAEAAIATFQSLKPNLLDHLKHCSSGKELIAAGFAHDIELAANLNVSQCVPKLTQAAYRHAESMPANPAD